MSRIPAGNQSALRFRIASVFAVLAPLAWHLAPSPATAATYYVNQAASNCPTEGTGTLALPYCTIGAAIAAHHSPSDVIIVQAGMYREEVTINNVVAQFAAPFELRADPGVVVNASRDHAQFTTGEWTWTGVAENYWIQPRFRRGTRCA